MQKIMQFSWPPKNFNWLVFRLRRRGWATDETGTKRLTIMTFSLNYVPTIKCYYIKRIAKVAISNRLEAKKIKVIITQRFAVSEHEFK